MKSIPITDISGFQIGYADNAALGTGCTAILCRAGAVAGCDVRGGIQTCWHRKTPWRQSTACCCRGDRRSGWRPERV